MPSFLTTSWLRRFSRFLPTKISPDAPSATTSALLYPFQTGETYGASVEYTIARQRPLTEDDFVANSMDIVENFCLFSLWYTGVETSTPKEHDRIIYNGINWKIRKVKETIGGALFSCLCYKEYS